MAANATTMREATTGVASVERQEQGQGQGQAEEGTLVPSHARQMVRWTAERHARYRHDRAEYHALYMGSFAANIPEPEAIYETLWQRFVRASRAFFGLVADGQRAAVLRAARRELDAIERDLRWCFEGRACWDRPFMLHFAEVTAERTDGPADWDRLTVDERRELFAEWIPNCVEKYDRGPDYYLDRRYRPQPSKKLTAEELALIERLFGDDELARDGVIEEERARAKRAAACERADDDRWQLVEEHNW